MKNGRFKIGIDARSISGKVCGVSRVAACLIKALSNIDTANEYVIYTDSVIPDLNLGKNFFIRPTYCSRNSPLYDIRLYSIIKGDYLDLYHATHSWLPEFLPRSVKRVVTIHDLFSVTDPDFFIKHKPFHGLFKAYLNYITGRSVRKADAIITVSNYCRVELENRFPLSRGKIHVIYNAGGINTAGGHSDGQRAIREDYLLYVGNCRSYKNVEVLIEGFNAFLKKGKDMKLVIAGNDFCGPVQYMVQKLRITDKVIFLSTPLDSEIRNLYQNASAFIMPSKYEGFGIPVVEAMSFGVPTIISDADALVEVAGSSALIFKRDRPEELSDAIGKILFDCDLRKGLVKSGRARAGRFTWESSALKLKELYGKLLR